MFPVKRAGSETVSPWSGGAAAQSGRFPGVDAASRDTGVLPFRTPVNALLEPVGIPVPYTTDDEGYAFPADSWLLLNGQWLDLPTATGGAGTYPMVPGTVANIAGTSWLGPAEVNLIGVAPGTTVTATWTDGVTNFVTRTYTNTTTQIQSATLDFPAEYAVFREVQVTISSGGSVAAVNVVDWRRFFIRFPVVPGSLPGGFTRRDNDDLAQGIQPFTIGSLLNLRYFFPLPVANAVVSMGFPVIFDPIWISFTARGGTSSVGPSWSECPDVAVPPIWTDPQTLNYHQVSVPSRGPVVDVAVGTNEVAGVYSSLVVEFFLDDVSIFSTTVPAGTGVVTIPAFAKPAGQAYSILRFTVNGDDPPSFSGRTQVFADVPAARFKYVTTLDDAGFTYLITTSLSRSPASPPVFSWPDSTQLQVHAGGYVPAQVRAPLVTGFEPIVTDGTPGALTATYTAAQVYSGNPGDLVVFRPGNATLPAPALYYGSQVGSAPLAPQQPLGTPGEYGDYVQGASALFNPCHGDGRLFFQPCVRGAGPTVVTLNPVTPLVTDFTGGSLTLDATMLTGVTWTPLIGPPITQTDPRYIFAKFTAPVAGTYRISCIGLGSLGIDATNFLGMQAELALSTVEPLAMASEAVSIPQDFVAPLVDAPNNDPSTKANVFSIVGPKPITPGLWAGRANQIAYTPDPSIRGDVFITPDPYQRYGNWYWDGATWKDGTALAVTSTIKATEGQTVYVRVSGQQPDRTGELCPLGAVLTWVVV